MTAVGGGVTDELIDACGFRMFALDEIGCSCITIVRARGGDYTVLGNKREVMAQLGNAVTPPATRLKLERIFAVIGGGGTFTDLFCGAGGSSIGAEIAGGELRLGLNHWDRAIETHATNFPDADHDCARLALIVPPSTDSMPRDAHREPSFVQVTETRPALLEVPD